MRCLRLAAVTLLVASSTWPSFSASAVVTELASGHILLSDSPAPPPMDDPRWEAVELPDDWSERRPSREGYAWYRFAFPALPDPLAEPFALYLPEFNVNAGVWVNGAPLGACGSLSEPVAYCWNRPLLISVPASLLSAAENRIDIRLVTYRPYGGLSPLLLGPESDLTPRKLRSGAGSVRAE